VRAVLGRNLDRDQKRAIALVLRQGLPISITGVSTEDWITHRSWHADRLYIAVEMISSFVAPSNGVSDRDVDCIAKALDALKRGETPQLVVEWPQASWIAGCSGFRVPFLIIL
jgi:hypothetical protein